VRRMVDEVALKRQASLPVIWFPYRSTGLTHILPLPEKQTGETWERQKKSSALSENGGHVGQTYTDGVSFRWAHCAKRQRRAVCLLAGLHLSGSCDVTSVLTSNGTQVTGPFAGGNCLERYVLDKGTWMICSLIEV